MTADDRSVSSLVQNIIQHIQEIIRSEVRLARTEITEQAGRAKAAGSLLAAGSLAAFFAALFLLVTAFLALSLVLPNWAAALIVSVVMGIMAMIVLSAGVKKLKQVNPKPERTIESLKENVEWMKQRK